MAVEPLPFATLAELKERWSDFPPGGDARAGIHLDDASQFILDVAPSAAGRTASTRRRVVCAVVKRAMRGETEGSDGYESMQTGTGPFQDTLKPLNPHGDYYLTSQEKKSLGVGRQRAFVIDPLAVLDAPD